MVKEELFYPFKYLTGTSTIFSTDASSEHLEKRKIFNKALGIRSQPDLVPVMDGYAKKFIDKWHDQGEVLDDVTSQAGHYLLPIIIWSTFGIDITQHQVKMQEIIGHLTDILSDFVALVSDPAFYPIPERLKPGYIRLRYPNIIAKGHAIHQDTLWLIEKAREQTEYRASHNEELVSSLFYRMMEKLVAEEKDHLTNEDVYDLANPLVAGNDTTGSFLTMLLRKLADDSEMQRVLKEELECAETGRFVERDAQGRRKWTAQQVNDKEMPELFAFIDETTD